MPLTEPIRITFMRSRVAPRAVLVDSNLDPHSLEELRDWAKRGVDFVVIDGSFWRRCNAHLVGLSDAAAGPARAPYKRKIQTETLPARPDFLTFIRQSVRPARYGEPSRLAVMRRASSRSAGPVNGLRSNCVRRRSSPRRCFLHGSKIELLTARSFYFRQE